MDQPKPTLQLTSRRELAVAAMAGGLGGWVLVTTLDLFDWQQPHLPWVGIAVLFFIAALVAVIAWTTHQRIQVRKEHIEPERAVTFLVLGKAAALGGALVAAGYLVLGLMNVDRIAAEGPRERLLRALVAMVAGVIICVSGMFLERACKLPEPPEDDESPTDPGS